MDELVALHEEHLDSIKDCEVDDYLLDCQEFIASGDVEGWRVRFIDSLIPPPPVKRTRGAPSRLLLYEPVKCVECQSMEVIEDVKQGQIVCTDCGLIQSMCILVPTYYDQERSTPIKVHRYSRIVYFKSVLNSLRGETKPQMTKPEIDLLLKHLTTPITPDSVSVALKACGLVKLRRHRTSIASVFGRYQPLIVDAALYPEILRMFRRVEVEYKLTPKRRIFLSYPYLIYQFLYHLGAQPPTTLLLKCRHLLLRQHKLYGPIAKKLAFTSHLDVYRK